jgi:hypothetical protein
MRFRVGFFVFLKFNSRSSYENYLRESNRSSGYRGARRWWIYSATKILREICMQKSRCTAYHVIHGYESLC